MEELSKLIISAKSIPRSVKWIDNSNQCKEIIMWTKGGRVAKGTWSYEKTTEWQTDETHSIRSGNKKERRWNNHHPDDYQGCAKYLLFC